MLAIMLNGMFSSFLNDFVHSKLIIYILVLAIAAMAVGTVLRIIFGKKGTLSQTVLICFAILFLYVLSIAIFGIEDGHSSILLGNLPFLGVVADYGTISLKGLSGLSVFFTEVLKLFFLTFFISVMETILKVTGKDKKVLIWYIEQCVIVFLANLFQSLVIDLATQYLPKELTVWIPQVIFFAIAALLLLRILGMIFKTVSFFSGPFVRAISSFFADNVIGRTITGAFTSTLIISVIAFITIKSGLLELTVIAAGIAAWAPVIILLLCIWYLVYKFL